MELLMVVCEGKIRREIVNGIDDWLFAEVKFKERILMGLSMYMIEVKYGRLLMRLIVKKFEGRLLIKLIKKNEKARELWQDKNFIFHSNQTKEK